MYVEDLSVLFVSVANHGDFGEAFCTFLRISAAAG